MRSFSLDIGVGSGTGLGFGTTMDSEIELLLTSSRPVESTTSKSYLSPTVTESTGISTAWRGIIKHECKDHADTTILLRKRMSLLSYHNNHLWYNIK
jgi:hypothetical protein